MIQMLRGVVGHRDATSVIIDVNGVGYHVHLADPSTVPAVGKELVLHTSLQVREDSMTLYGFVDRTGLVLFELLLTASGVGPKLALACLATLAPASLRTAIATADLAMLSSVPGVGKKVAQRMVLELKDKVGGVGDDLEKSSGMLEPVGGPRGTVREALTGLGYSGAEITQALRGLESDDESALLRDSLRRLAGANA